MSFNVVLCNCPDPPNKLSKNTTTGTSGTISCTPYEPMSDLTGYIIIDWHGDYEGCNYLTMTETWGDEEEPQTRTTYYFITDIVKDIGGKMRLILRRDVLMTFKSDINNLDLHVTRCSLQAGIVEGKNTTGYNSMIPDGTITMTAQKYFINIPFTRNNGSAKFSYPDYSDPTQNQYVLAVIG